MLPSFTGKGAGFDNAVIESVWATLKRKLVYPRERFASRDEARTAIFEFIEVYYRQPRKAPQLAGLRNPGGVRVYSAAVHLLSMAGGLGYSEGVRENRLRPKLTKP